MANIHSNTSLSTQAFFKLYCSQLLQYKHASEAQIMQANSFPSMNTKVEFVGRRDEGVKSGVVEIQASGVKWKKSGHKRSRGHRFLQGFPGILIAVEQ